MIKRKIEKIEPQKSISDTLNRNSRIIDDRPYDKELFEILKELRLDVARKNLVPPFIVFTDLVLKQMSTVYPTNVESMLKINGVGDYKIEKYGDVFIEAIKKYVEDNNIDVYDNVYSSKSDSKNFVSSSYVDKAVEKVASRPREDTKLITYNLYREGKSVKDISVYRNLTVQTIQNHLLKCYEDGMDVDIEKEINTKFEGQIYEAIRNIGIEKLKPLKEALPEEVSYMDIKYYILKYKKSDEVKLA